MNRLAASLEPVFRRWGVPFAYLWGSRARGRARPDSDIDLAVSYTGSSARFLELSAQIAETLGVDEVDVTWLEEATPEVRFLVAQHGRSIFEQDARARIRFACLARKLYWDEQPRLARHDGALVGRLRDGTFGA